jgi:hypothetical protein
MIPGGMAESDPLRPYRDRWTIQSRRDGFALVSAELQPTDHSVIYVVASSAEKLAEKLAEIERGLSGGES